MGHATELYGPTTGVEVNELINHLSRVAMRLDEEVHDVAFDTGLTERSEITRAYDARQRLVRRMARVAHELNSLLPDDFRDEIADNAQPREYDG